MVSATDKPASFHESPVSMVTFDQVRGCDCDLGHGKPSVTRQEPTHLGNAGRQGSSSQQRRASQNHHSHSSEVES